MRILKFIYLLFFMSLGIVMPMMAQPPVNGNENSKFQNTENNANKVDTILKTNTKKIKTKEDSEAEFIKDSTSNTQKNNEGVVFDLFNRQKASVSSDELSIDMGEPQIVKATEEIRIGEDSSWVKVADYYTVWDSKFINPYNKKAEAFNEIINILLYDTELGRFWATPIHPALLTSNFGYRWGTFHHGVDLNLEYGQPVYSVFDGIVRISGYDYGYGNYIVVRHFNGLETLYGHLSARKVDSKQFIKAGQLIGLGGSTGWSTGPHLHLEVRYQGNSINPLHIFDFSDPKNTQLKSQTFTLMPQHFSHLGNQINTIIYHQVGIGETLETISKKYNVSVQQLSEINGLESAELRVGQRLKIR